jgi:hypothetical protein
MPLLASYNITIKPDSWIKHPPGLGVASSIDNELSQFQYLDIQSSYDVPKGTSSIEKSLIACTLVEPTTRRAIKEPKRSVA